MKFKPVFLVGLVLMVLVFSCTPGNDLKVGLLMDDYVQERWHKDQDLFIQKVEELGGEVLVESSRGDENLQLELAKKLLNQGIKVLVVVPSHAEDTYKIINEAHKKGVQVIAYDRIIKNADLDYYVSFDNIIVGEMQADFVTQRIPTGGVAIIGGAPSDYNSVLYHEGYMNVLRPKVERGDIKIVYDQQVKEWKAEEAYKHMKKFLSTQSNELVAVIAANDALADGVVKALEEVDLDGKVLVTGMDAELEAVRRIVKGTQAMTIYKPIEALAFTAAQTAITLAKNEAVKNANRTIYNGKKYVPSILLSPITVDADNIRSTVVADSHLDQKAIYGQEPGSALEVSR
jgi:D-xylose transport system substrate-binding protein